MSEEFSGQEASTSETPAETKPELTLDDLFNSQVNEEAVNKTAKEMSLKSGTYVTKPPFAPTLSVFEGRRYIKFWGTVELGDVSGKISYRISPDLRHAKDRDTGEDTGKPDSASKLYVQAVKAFEVAYNRKPANDKEIVEYLRDFPHKVRVWQSDDGESRVVAISAVKQPSVEA